MYVSLKNLHLGRDKDGKQIIVKIGEPYSGKDAEALYKKGHLEKKEVIDAKAVASLEAELAQAKAKVKELEARLKAGEAQKGK